MNPWIRLRLGGLALAVLTVTHAADALPRSSPEAQGVSSGALLDLVNTLDREIEGMHSVMVVRRGHVIAEAWWAPYAAGHNHVLYSLSKSFTSTAVGLAVAEGRLSIDDEVLNFFPAEAPAEPSAHLKAMRVRDLLTMATGHQDEPPTSPDAMSARSFLAHPVPHLPGTHFKYNTPATFMQSAIVQQVTGQTVLDYLRPRLFEPLGITHPVWDTNFQGVTLGGYGLRVRTEDIAKLGQLYLQKGRWDGRPLLPAPWIEAASSKQVSNGSNPNSDWNQGYGFQFWRCRHNAFRGDGAFGQYCVVMPDQEAVIAITSGVRDMQAVLNVLWDKFLPACDPERLSPDAAAQTRLNERLARLELPPAPGAETSPVATRAFNRRFVFPPNDQKLTGVTLAASDGGSSLKLTLELDGRELVLPAGFRRWQTGRSSFPAGPLAQFPDEPVAGTFGWVSDHTLEIKVCAYETPFNSRFRFAFEEDRVTLDREANVAFGPTKSGTLVGQAELRPNSN